MPNLLRPLYTFRTKTTPIVNSATRYHWHWHCMWRHWQARLVTAPVTLPVVQYYYASSFKSLTAAGARTTRGFHTNFNGVSPRRCLTPCSRQQLSRGLSTTSTTAKPPSDPLLWKHAEAESGIAGASTPPSSWYNDPRFYKQVERPFTFRNWVWIGRAAQVQSDGDYLAGMVAGEPFVVVNNGGQLTALSNVCRHHAAQILDNGTGKLNASKRLVCPYHGWEYTSTNGRLAKAMHMKGCKDFTARDVRLPSYHVDRLGPWLFLCMGESPTGSLIGDQPDMAQFASMLSGSHYENLVHLQSRSYTLNCNWKVFVDNYLDGGYHVPVAHPGLSQSLNMAGYKRAGFENFFLQSCGSKAEAENTDNANPASISSNRVHGEALYLYHYPSLMVNRYGDWMDTNVVLPLGSDRCEVVFDWFVHPLLLSQQPSVIEEALKDSERVQQEDIWLCERVQTGLDSMAYDVGRYSPEYETGEYMFHQRLYRDYMKSISPAT